MAQSQIKHINRIENKYFILHELSQNESVTWRSNMSQTLSQIVAKKVGQIPRRKIDLVDEDWIDPSLENTGK